MVTRPNHLNQVEGKWEDLISQPERFAGQRVRVTVLSGQGTGAVSLQAEIRRWLSEGDALEFKPPANTKSDAFGNALVEKYRKQGLVL